MSTPHVSAVFALFDDESVRKKLTVMDKWDAMMDDSRNPDDFGERVESMLEPGKTYLVTVEILQDIPGHTLGGEQ